MHHWLHAPNETGWIPRIGTNLWTDIQQSGQWGAWPRWIETAVNPLGGDYAPILGGSTAVTLTSAATLGSLGVTVTPLGSTTLDVSGTTPVARFDITGGTDGPDASDVILHQGGGLALADAAGTVALRDFRIDLPNQTVYANVSVNGVDAGNVGVFAVGSDASLTLTSAAADVVATALDAPAITPDVVIGTAAPSPEVGLDALLHQLGSQDGPQFLCHPADTKPIIGGETGVTLSSAATLASLGVEVSPLGSATVDTSAPDPIALFPITGGTVGPGDGVSVILHQDSGLELSSGSDQVSLRDLLIDTQNHVVDANVTVNGTAVGNVPVFDIANDLTLNLTQQSATVLADTFGSGAFTPGLTVGSADPHPIGLPVGPAFWS